jgi:hypothetical protein
MVIFTGLNYIDGNTTLYTFVDEDNGEKFQIFTFKDHAWTRIFCKPTFFGCNEPNEEVQYARYVTTNLLYLTEYGKNPMKMLELLNLIHHHHEPEFFDKLLKIQKKLKNIKEMF